MTERAAHRHQRGAKQGAPSCIIFPFISSPDPCHRNFFNDDEQHDNQLIDGGISFHFHWLPTWFSLQLYCGEPATLRSSCSSWLNSIPPHVPCVPPHVPCAPPHVPCAPPHVSCAPHFPCPPPPAPPHGPRTPLLATRAPPGKSLSKV